MLRARAAGRTQGQLGPEVGADLRRLSSNPKVQRLQDRGGRVRLKPGSQALPLRGIWAPQVETHPLHDNQDPEMSLLPLTSPCPGPSQWE